MAEGNTSAEGSAPGICLSTQNFQNLSLVIEDTVRWMQQAAYIILLYEQDVQLTNEQIRQLRQTGLQPPQETNDEK